MADTDNVTFLRVRDKMGDKEQQHQQTATTQVYTWSTGNGHGTVAQKSEDPAAAYASGVVERSLELSLP